LKNQKIVEGEYHMKRVVLLFFTFLLLIAWSGCASLNKKSAVPKNITQTKQVVKKEKIEKEKKSEFTSTPITSKKQKKKPFILLKHSPLEKKKVKKQIKPEVYPGITGKKEGKKRVELNFDNADIKEVIETFANLLNFSYILDPNVAGKVSLHTKGEVEDKDLFPIFTTLMRINGFSVEKEGSIYHIMPLKVALKGPSPVTFGKKPPIRPTDPYMVQIIPLKYIAPDQVKRVIIPYLSKGGKIADVPGANSLIISDYASNLKKLISIIDLLDVNIFSKVHMRLYSIQHIDVVEVAKKLEEIFGPFNPPQRGRGFSGIYFIPIEYSNSLLMLTTFPEMIPSIEKWIKAIDTAVGEGTVEVHVYYVQNGKAEDIVKVLKEIFVDLKGAKAKEKLPTVKRYLHPSKPLTPTSPTKSKSTPPTKKSTISKTTSTKKAKSLTGKLESPVTIVADPVTNAILVRSTRRDFKTILKTIKKLDIYPKQVLIEVMLAEITLDDETKMGLEWSTFTDRFKNMTYTIGMGGTASSMDETTGMLTSPITSGLRYAIAEAGKLAAAIHASAAKGNVNVISSPHILASDNKEAKITVSIEQPTLTNTYTSTQEGASTGVIEGTIEYRDTGIILTVTPHINEKGLVTLDLSIEDSKVSYTTLGNLQNVPAFKKKKASTTLSVLNGQTLVIGGLIEDSKEKSRSGVPFLNSIPLLGFLFGYWSDTITKKELVLMLTPHVISNMETSRNITNEFLRKLRKIQDEFKRHEKEIKKPGLNRLKELFK